MKFRGLIIAACVLCALAIALYWSSRHKPSAENAAPAANNPPILKTDTQAITAITLKTKGAEPITLEKSAGNWRITAPAQYNADQETVAQMLSTLSALDSQRLIENNAVNLQQYGLKDPSFELDFTGKDNKTQSVSFGDATPTGDAVYAMAGGDPKVFTTASYNQSSLKKTLNDLRDKRLLPVNSDKINRLELIKGNQAIVFGRVKNGWQILKPQPLRTDDSAVDSLINQLAEAKMDLSGPSSSDVEKAFDHAAPLATAKVTSDQGTQTLQVRKSKSGDYAQSSAVKGDYKVDSSLGAALDKNLNDFRNKSLFDFSFHQPDKIELHDGSTDWLFTWNGTNWLSAGKKVDSDSMNSLVSNLRGLTASNFADSGFGKPEITLVVTSQNGKDVERVSIAKSGKNYIAKHEGEPSLYVLNATDVSGMLKSAQDVKPATPAAK